MQPKRLPYWVPVILALVITGCSTAPIQTAVEPSIEPPIPTSVEASLPPTDLPAAKPTEAPEPTLTEVIPTSEPTAAAQGSSIKGDQIMQSICTICHSPDRIINSHKSQSEWEITVNRMIGHGAVLNDSEKQILIQYLSETYK